METVIARLLKDFEEGKMNRRQLIQSLAMAAAAAALPGRASAAPVREASGFKAIGIDHISYHVKDYHQTRDFYADLLGMPVEEDSAAGQARLFFNDEGGHLIVRNRADPAPESGPTSFVHHISYHIDDWDTDAVEAELRRRGHEPRLDTGTPGRRPWASFHVQDPDGYGVQISGDLKPGDRLYPR